MKGGATTARRAAADLAELGGEWAAALVGEQSPFAIVKIHAEDPPSFIRVRFALREPTRKPGGGSLLVGRLDWFVEADRWVKTETHAVLQAAGLLAELEAIVDPPALVAGSSLTAFVDLARWLPAIAARPAARFGAAA